METIPRICKTCRGTGELPPEVNGGPPITCLVCGGRPAEETVQAILALARRVGDATFVLHVEDALHHSVDEARDLIAKQMYR